MEIKKRRLGKGLDSLISSSEYASGSDGGVLEIPLSRIELNPDQPREQIDGVALEGLAKSIRNDGVLQPVLVRPAGNDGMYELVMGERRLRAARLAGLERVPAVVRQVKDDRMLELALVENVQREDLNAIEKARALARMGGELALTQSQVAERVGLGRPTVANLLRLLELPEAVRDMVSRGTLSGGHARALLAVEGDDLRLSLARRVVEEGLSVRETERLASSAGDTKGAPKKNTYTPPPHISRLQAILSDALHADVRIRGRGKKGRIIIGFSDHEEFERLFSAFTGGDAPPA